MTAGTSPASPPIDPSPDPDLAVDFLWMSRALEMARRAACLGEVPVGAVLVGPDGLAAEGHNLTVTSCDPTAHAEVVVIRQAAGRLGDWRLPDFTLYTTLEPCALCSGAIVLSRIRRVVYGAADPKAGMAGTLENLVQDPRLNHRVSLTTGVLADASSRLLQEFFRRRRE